MSGWILSLTEDPWQVFTLDLEIDGQEFHAQVELRYLPAPDRWYVSLWDHASGELLVNMIPLVCSCGKINDLLLPFRHLRGGKGLGSLFCLKGTDAPSTPDPSENNLSEFRVVWSDIMDPNS